MVRAPELVGHGGWIGTDGELSLRALRGKVVVLNFWTFACAKCIRVIDDLEELQSRFPGEVVVIGVHSPKFPFAGEHRAVARAVVRLDLTHPVLDDPNMVTWQQYGVRGWPTVVVLDPDGEMVGALSGEGKGPLLHQIVQDLVEKQRRSAGTWLARPSVGTAAPAALPRRVPALYPAPRAGGLAFPTKVATDRRGRLAIADTGHDRVLIVHLQGETTGRVTHVVTGLRRPRGVRLYGSDLIICDTGHDRVVAVDLAQRPGLDEAIEPDPAGIIHLRVLPSETVAVDLASPWDVIADLDGSYVVAEAAKHRLWRVPTDGSSPAVIAGDGYEGLVDGHGEVAELAQPSGLTRLPNGVAFVDAESSALRLLNGKGQVGTLVGVGLFDWGRRDGRRGVSRLQHPEGVVAALDGTSLYVADTFNHQLRWWRDGKLVTVPTEGLLEPSGLDVLPDGRLVVADSANHRVCFVDPASGRVQPLELLTLELADPAPIPQWGSSLRGMSDQPLAVPFAIDLGRLELDGGEGAPVRVQLGCEPSWLLEPGPRVWSHVLEQGGLALVAGSPGSGILTVTVSARMAAVGISATRRTITEHRLTIE